MNQYHSRKKYLEKKKEKTEVEMHELKEASKHYYVLKKFNWMFFTSPMTTEYSTLMKRKYTIGFLKDITTTMISLILWLNMVYEYVDELDDLIHDINQKLDDLIKKAEKKNHNPSSDYDSPVQF